MPFVEHKARNEFNIPVMPEREEPTAPSIAETADAAFRLENDVVNAFELMNRPQFTDDPNFNTREGLQNYDSEHGTQYWETYRDNFVGVGSVEEMLNTMQRIDQENADRAVMERAGWTGTVFAVAAGTVSPTLFIPFMGPGRGAKALAQAVGLAGIAAAIQEMPLQANQETRTAEETAFSVGASAVIGGFLGGAVVALRKGEYEAIKRGMAPSYNDTAISPTSIGAAVNELYGTGGKLASGAGTVAKVINSNPVTRNPVLHTVEGSSPSAASRMQVLSDAGLRYENNAKGIPTAAGGTVENSIADYYSRFAKAIGRYDEIYQDYAFNGGPAPRLFTNTRADRAATKAGRLSKKEFNEAVYDAMVSGDVHEIPQGAAAAQAWRTEIYTPMLDEARRAGLPIPELADGEDASYLFRDYDTQAIRANPMKFIDIVSKHINDKLQAGYREELLKLSERTKRSEELIEDLQRPASEVNRLREQFKAQLEEVQNITPQNILDLEDRIAHTRALAREAGRGAIPGVSGVAMKALRKQLLADAKEMEASGGDALVKARGTRASLRRRLANLSKARAVLEQKQSRVFEQINDLENAAIDSMERVARKGKQVLNKLDKVSDKELDKEINDLTARLNVAGRQLDRAEDRLAKEIERAGPGSEDLQTLLAREASVGQKGERVLQIVKQLEDAEGLDRTELRTIITNGLEIVAEDVAGLTLRRGKRLAKLEQRAKKLDPAQVTGRIEELRAGMKARQSSFFERQRERGADDVTLDGADFSQYAEDFATKFKDKVLGTTLRLPAFDMLSQERGPELARMLDIDSRKIREFVVRDPERLGRSYLRTVGPDIELTRRFGTLNTGEIWQPVIDEMNQRLKQIADNPDLTAEQKAKRSQALDAEYRQYKNNFEGVWGRIRNTWGLPNNPEGIATRAADTMMKLNVMRMMGRVVISSVPDMQRPIQRYGLTRVFGDAFVPMITNWKAFKLNAREARRMQGGLDPVLQSRGRAMFDIMDDLQRGTKFERAVDHATSKFGLIALFDQWTDAMKQYSGVVANAKMMDALALVATGQGKAGEINEATRFLAEQGFGPEQIQRIWAQVQSAGGGGKVNGMWWPNTEAWVDADARRWYHSAMHREGDISIVTPGVDSPLWMDQTIPGRMLAQFKSFGMASTTKMMMAGLQQRDMALINGTMISLALGALSYYLYGMAAGGKAYEDMVNADPGKWADEAIDRSGILAILGEVRRIGETIPAVSPYVSFSGQRTTRRGGEDFVGALAGPSADFVEKLASIITGINDPTRSTGHALRLLMPLQNTPIFSAGYDAIERAANLKESRSQ